MAILHVRTQFNLSDVGAVSGESAADISTDATKRGTGDAGYAEFLAALGTHYSTTFTPYSIEFANALNVQIIVFEGVV
jgi:hypothetical protein